MHEYTCIHTCMHTYSTHNHTHSKHMLTNTHFNKYLFATNIDNSNKHFISFLKIHLIGPLPVNIGLYIYTHIYVGVYICVCICIHTCICVCICIWMCAHCCLPTQPNFEQFQFSHYGYYSEDPGNVFLTYFVYLQKRLLHLYS